MTYRWYISNNLGKRMRTTDGEKKNLFIILQSA
jgi:hypothetical protein